MHIPSITAATYTSPIAAASAAPVDATTAAAQPVPGTTTTGLSKLGSLMSQLQNLVQTNPAQAKAVLAKIGSDLKDKASATSDPQLGALADKFTQASQTGDLSAIKSQGGGHAHHHHHGGGGGGGASSQVNAYKQSSADPMSAVESIIAGDLPAS